MQKLFITCAKSDAVKKNLTGSETDGQDNLQIT